MSDATWSRDGDIYKVLHVAGSVLTKINKKQIIAAVLRLSNAVQVRPSPPLP
jgi:hypothetical protein